MNFVEIEYHIENVWTISEYIDFVKSMDIFNRNKPSINDNIYYWEEKGITTASQLHDYRINNKG